MKKQLILLAFALLLITSVSAFSLDKRLVQTETDPNYPCHVEGINTIVCDALTDEQVTQWQSDIDTIATDKALQSNIITEEQATQIKQNIQDSKLGQVIDPEQIIPDVSNEALFDDGLTANDVKANLDLNRVPVKTATGTYNINVRQNQKIDVNLETESQVVIGYSSNVFGVQGTPLENFDVNTTTGLVHYRPLNMTWLNFSTNQKITIPNMDKNDVNATFSIWFNYSSSCDVDKYIFRDGQGRFFIGCVANKNNITVTVSNLTGSYYLRANSAFNDSNWHNLIITSLKQGTSSNQSLFIDSTIMDSFNLTNMYATGGSGTIDYDINSWNGPLDEFRIYNTTLTSNNILSIYQSGRTGNTSLNSLGTLTRWYRMNEKTGLTVHDASNSGNNGTITGATWQSDGINVTTLGYNVDISINNITSALIFWDNGTLINQSFTGNQTFTFLNNQSIYVLENYNTITQGSPRTYDPFAITTSGNNRQITSTINEAVNETVVYTIADCSTLRTISYASNTGTYTNSWTPASVCSNGVITLSGVVIENGSSNVITADIQTVGCDSSTSIGFGIIMVLSSLALFAYVAYFVYSHGLDGLEIGEFIMLFVAIIVALTLWLASGQNLGNFCAVG